MLSDYIPPYDATVIARLKAAGAVILGKTNMDEFAMGGSTENSAFQLTRNPWDLMRTPGGSSGGAAASVAAGMVSLSIGTDTGGSIRQPAAFCGVVGLKPSYGRVSRYGLVAYASSLDQVGVIAHTAEDAALLLEAIAGHDPADSTSAQRPVPKYSQSVTLPLEGLRLGLVREHFVDGLDEEVGAALQNSIDVFRSLGATITEISMPHSKYAIATYYIIAPCEASSNLARYDGAHYGRRAPARSGAGDKRGGDSSVGREERTAAAPGAMPSGNRRSGPVSESESALVQLYCRSRAEGFGPEVKRRIMLGTYALSAGYYDAYYLKAQQVRRLIRDDYEAAFRQVDLIIGPTTPRPAFALGEMADDPLAMYLQDLYTVGANLAGVAGISLPCGKSRSELPIGVQLQAPPFEEDRVLRAAYMFQQETDWHRHHPRWTAPL
jgi:aspartyl-tRNA(Asn)/glutamyl-tRNA(Gln) amidotransferase subunit A